MDNPVAVLAEATQALEALGIPYAVVGSVASSLYGFSRATGDVDIIADIRPEHVAPLVAALQDSFYADEQAIRRAVQLRRSFNAIHFDSLFRVDFYVLADDDFSRQQLQRRKLAQLLPDSAQTVYLATAEDTILAKLRWYRQGGEASAQQLTDVTGILKVQGENLDLEYLRRWAERLGLRDLLARVLRETG